MKQGIHPVYHEVVVKCTCGNEIPTGSTRKDIKIEICSNCHPFFTGKQKLIDTAGRIDKFHRKYGDDNTDYAKRSSKKAKRLSDEEVAAMEAADAAAAEEAAETTAE